MKTTSHDIDSALGLAGLTVSALNSIADAIEHLANEVGGVAVELKNQVND